jgi:RPA family protein
MLKYARAESLDLFFGAARRADRVGSYVGYAMGYRKAAKTWLEMARKREAA